MTTRTAADAALDVVNDCCSTPFDGFGVVWSTSPLLRPRRKGWTAAHAQGQLVGIARLAIDSLRREANLAAAQACVPRNLVGCITITRGQAALIATVAGRFSAGDNACDASVEHGVARVMLWYDRSHPR